VSLSVHVGWQSTTTVHTPASVCARICCGGPYDMKMIMQQTFFAAFYIYMRPRLLGAVSHTSSYLFKRGMAQHTSFSFM
jgi:hypothetical protein